MFSFVRYLCECAVLTAGGGLSECVVLLEGGGGAALCVSTRSLLSSTNNSWASIGREPKLGRISIY